MINTGRDRLAIFILAAFFLAGGGCTRQMRKERILAQAGRDFDSGAYDKAELEYRKARKLDPLDPVAIRQLGIIYFNEGRPLDAYPFLRKAIDLEPKNVAARLKLGEVSSLLGEVKAARDSTKQVLQAEPSNEEALLLLGATARLPAEEDETTRLVDQFRQDNPDCAGYHVVLSRMLLDHGDADGAEKEIRRALELDPKSSAAHEDLGSLYLRRGDSKQAAQEYRTAASLSPLRSLCRLREIDFRMRTGSAAEAKKDLEVLIAQAPDYIPALVFAMKTALGEQRFADCEAIISGILQREPRDYDALLARGALKEGEGDSAAAIDALLKAEGVYPRSAEIQYQLGLGYLKTGDLTKAENRFNRALALDPEFDDATLVLAELDMRKGDEVTAIRLLDQITQRRARLGMAYLLLARAYTMHGEPDQALTVYRKLAAEFPKDPQVPYLAGLVLTKVDRREDARQAFEKAMEIDPGYGAALDMLVNLDLAERHIDAAAARIEGFMQKNPKSARPWMLRADVDRIRGDTAASETDLLKAIDMDPGAQDAYIKLAQLYVSTHQSARAIERLTAYVAKTKNIDAQMVIAAIHESLSQFESAAADYRGVLGSNPEYGPALNNLAYLYSEHLGKVGEAYDLAKRAREVAPDESNTADTLGWILYRRGDYRGALELVQECIQKAPDNAAAQVHLGMIHCRLGEEGPAREAFQRALTGPSGAQLKEEIAGSARQELAVLMIDPGTATRAVLADLEIRAKADPDDPVVLTRLGAVQARFGESEQAAKTLTAALNLAPRYTAAMLTLAQLYSGPLRDPEKARLMAKSAHEIAPNDPRISETLGNTLYGMGDYRWSSDLLQEAARAEVERPALQYELARAQYASGQVSEAEATLKRLAPGGPGFPQRDEANRLAAMIAASESPEMAQASADDARKILEKDPDYLPAMVVSALAFERQGDPSSAAAVYEKILAKDPDFTPAIRQVVLISAKRTGDDQKAYDLGVKAHEAFPVDPSVSTALGIIDYRRGDYAAAVRLLQESLRERIDDGETLSYLGMSHLALGQTYSAKSELQRALQLNLPARLADSVRRALDEMKSDDSGEHSTDSAPPIPN